MPHEITCDLFEKHIKDIIIVTYKERLIQETNNVTTIGK